MGSLEKIYKEFLAANPHALDYDEELPYIPSNGAIVSPLVEVFRTGTAEGYEFMAKPARLACVVSIAMYNMNASMKDAPVDAPVDDHEYDEGVRTKFRVALTAALGAEAVALVMPDVGCGVYQNSPERVGRLFGEVVRNEFWGHLKEIAVVGLPAFQDAVKEIVDRICAEEDAKKQARAGMAGSMFSRLHSAEGRGYQWMSDSDDDDKVAAMGAGVGGLAEESTIMLIDPSPGHQPLLPRENRLLRQYTG